MLDNQRDKFGSFIRTRNSHENAFMLCWQLTCAIQCSVYGGAKDINPKLKDDLGRLMRWGFMERPRLVNLDYIDRSVCKAVININHELREPTDHPPVPYLEPQFDGKGAVVNYVTNYCSNYRVLNGDIDWTLALDDTNGWYVVSTNGCAFKTGADVAENCHARIILRDGTLLWSFHEDFDKGPSIDVEKTGAALTIYGQSTSTNVMGRLEAQGDTYGAGIGAGHNHDGKRITINGGKVTARGGEKGSGIGGGYGGSGYDITINGGWVLAYGGEKGAGIGGGEDRDGYNITVNGGLVEAASGEYAAGIGGGFAGSGHHITINGGYTRVVGYHGGAGIGGGAHNNGGGEGYAITVNGGTVDADEVWHAYNLGHGDNGGEPFVNEVAIAGGSIWANGRGKWECWGLKNPTNAVGQAIYEVTVPSDLVSTITNAVPTTRLKTTAGLYYGMAGAGSVQAIGAATPSNWELGDGTEKEIRGARPAGATDKAFYQLRVTTEP